MMDKEHIIKVIGEVLEGTDFFLVDVHVSRTNLIQVYLDSPSGISLDDCAGFSRRIEESLDRESEDFELQVSSPGLGQPLRVLPQYHKSVGEKIDILLEDDSRLKGTLLAVDGSADSAVLTLQLTGTKKKPAPAEPVKVLLSQIKMAKIEIDFNKV